MINIIGGQTAVTSTPDNAPQKKSNTSQPAQSTVSANTSAESTAASNSMQEDTAVFQTQTQTQAAGQAEGNNPDNVDYQKEALSKLMTRLRKEYIDRNHYIDENTQISVLQIVNTETDHVIGQYPSDLYLSLLAKVRGSQKQLVNQTI